MILGSLAVLAGTVQSFCQLLILTNICATEHSYFFLCFVDRIKSISGEYIYHPCDEDEVKQTLACYEEVGLPGAVGSVNVVHIKWSNCPAGHMNRSKGKEGYPLLLLLSACQTTAGESLGYLAHTLTHKMISILVKWIQMLELL